MIESYRANEVIIFWKAHLILTSLLVKAFDGHATLTGPQITSFCLFTCIAQSTPIPIFLNAMNPQAYTVREPRQSFSRNWSVHQLAKGYTAASTEFKLDRTLTSPGFSTMLAHILDNVKLQKQSSQERPTVHLPFLNPSATRLQCWTYCKSLRQRYIDYATYSRANAICHKLSRPVHSRRAQTSHNRAQTFPTVHGPFPKLGPGAQPPVT